MPLATYNFCKNHYNWTSDLVKKGAQLRYLCHHDWSGQCTQNTHTQACIAFFNNKKFSVPLEHHISAVREHIKLCNQKKN